MPWDQLVYVSVCTVDGFEVSTWCGQSGRVGVTSIHSHLPPLLHRMVPMKGVYLCILDWAQTNCHVFPLYRRPYILIILFAWEISARINYHNSGRYPSPCLLFKAQLNSIGLSVPRRKHITSPSPTGLWRWYINVTHNSEHYPSSCLSFKTQLNSRGLSVPHKKHITPPLRAEQVNTMYRFVTMVY
jgi:hypothetical protein